MTLETNLVGRITVFSITGCPHCLHAKESLHKLGLPYVDINLEKYPGRRSWVQEKTGKTSVPQIFFNARHIGGNAELQNLLKDENKEEFSKILEDVEKNEAPEDAPKPPTPEEETAKDSSSDFVCEPDEIAALVAELKETSVIDSHWSGLCRYKHTFKGIQFVEWISKKKNIDQQKGLEIGQLLLDQHFCLSINNKTTFKADSGLYRLLEDTDSVALNAGKTSQCTPSSVNQLGESLRQLILKLYSAHLSSNGQKVDYDGISKDPEFESYKKLTYELVRVQITEASRSEKLAFFINIYNSLVIHANIERGPPTNVWQRYWFFNSVKYIIGGYEYSLQDIENGVLRANRKGVGQFSHPFSKSDPRCSVALETHEPLIHFALVCGAKSCPPVKTYSAQDIENELSMAAQSFLEDDNGCEVTDKQVKFSMILKWYYVDFAENDQQLLQFICDHLSEGDKKTSIAALIPSGQYKITYIPYDWSVNA